MTPGARLQAAAEVLDRISGSSAPADQVLRAWGRANRYAGSGDRRAVADRVFRVLRARQRLAWAAGGEDGRSLVLASLALLDAEPAERIAALYSGQGYGPAALTEEERARLLIAGDRSTPEWAAAGLPAFVLDDLRLTHGDGWAAEAEALLGSRAPVDLRMNTLKTTREAARAALAEEGLLAEPTPWSPWGLRLPAEPPPDVQGARAFRDGLVEVQDEGSQLVARLADARPGETVVDYCAGGGGKALVLAAMMGGEGRLVACDVDPRRLEAIRPRLARAGGEAQLRLLGEDGEGADDLAGVVDLVLVDAPCSGSGTWRRRPEEASRLTTEAVERFHALQLRVLIRAARLVKPGGRLAYVTCSVLRRENEDVADAFEAQHSDVKPLEADTRLRLPVNGPRLRLSPHATATDGFFFAGYRRTA